MKIRESGMPDEGMWQGFFNPSHTLSCLALNPSVHDVAEFGCGYGTFTIPAAQLITGQLHAFDLEPDMLDATRAKADAEGIADIEYYLRDFLLEGTGLPEGSVDYAMLFNILHGEQPLELLQESYRILSKGGQVGIMHWNCDPTTPRGPPMDIRPKPEDMVQWAEAAGFTIVARHVDLPPYHYGVIAQKE